MTYHFDNIFSQIQTSVLFNIPKTENYYIDMFIFPIFIALVGSYLRKLKSNLPIIYNYIKNFFFLNNKLIAKLCFEGQISYTSHSIKVNYDRGMSAFFTIYILIKIK